MSITRSQPARTGNDLAGSDPIFPVLPGATLQTSLHLPDLQQKRLIFSQLGRLGQIHVYSAECRAGDRIRVQMLVPVLPLGGAVVPAFAVIAQSLPYKADIQKLPVSLPAGFSAVVAPPPTELVSPVRDVLTRAHYYPGPIIDTRTLVGGRVYLVVWSPHNHMGKYAIQAGTRWPLRWTYWTKLPAIWWQIRGWFGLSRAAAVATIGTIALGIFGLIHLLNRRTRL